MSRRGFRVPNASTKEINPSTIMSQDRNMIKDVQNNKFREEREGRLSETADSKTRDKEMVMRAVFGNVGDNGKPGDYSKKLDSELQNPAQPMTEGEANFRKNPFGIEALKQKFKGMLRPPKTAAPATDQTDQAIAFAMNAPKSRRIMTSRDENGQPIYQTVTTTPEEAMRDAQKRFKKFKPDDPRWEGVRTRFGGKETPMEPKPNMGSPENPSMPGPDDDENEIATQFPGAFQAQDGQWYVQNEKGFHKIVREE